jgi:hypothetical protein
MTRLWPEGEAIESWGSGEVADGFYWHCRPQPILDVCNRWRVHTRWWEPQQGIWREYCKVVTDTGMLCLIYRDSGVGWFLARVYD